MRSHEPLPPSGGGGGFVKEHKERPYVPDNSDGGHSNRFGGGNVELPSRFLVGRLIMDLQAGMDEARKDLQECSISIGNFESDYEEDFSRSLKRNSGTPTLARAMAEGECRDSREPYKAELRRYKMIEATIKIAESRMSGLQTVASLIRSQDRSDGVY